MRKLIVSEFFTLDGVIQAPGGVNEDTDGDFKFGAWTIPYWHDDIGSHFLESIKGCDAFLLGRKTWETHGRAFNHLPAGDPFGDVMNNMQKYVVSTTLSSSELWRNSTIIKGNLVDEVTKIKRSPGKNIYLDGSSVLAHSLFENNLVDEVSLLIYPMVLGKGKKLFPTGYYAKFKLLENKVFPNGVVLLRYNCQ